MQNSYRTNNLVKMVSQGAATWGDSLLQESSRCNVEWLIQENGNYTSSFIAEYQVLSTIKIRPLYSSKAYAVGKGVVLLRPLYTAI